MENYIKNMTNQDYKNLRYENDIFVFLKKNEDKTELDFLNFKIKSINEVIQNIKSKTLEYYCVEEEKKHPYKNNSDISKEDYNESIKSRAKYFKSNMDSSIQSRESDIEFYNFKIKRLTNSNTEHKIQNKSLKWKGSQTEFVELIKALIENDTIKNEGTQEDTIKIASDFFGIKINNPSKLITDINRRNNGSETLFLDKLKSSLFNYIMNKNKR